MTDFEDRDLRLRALADRLHVLEAMQLAHSRPQDLLRLVAGVSADQAMERLRDEWDLDDVQCHAVLDLQIRRFTADWAARLNEDIDSLREDRRRLLSGEDSTG